MKKNAFAFLLMFISVTGDCQNRDSVMVKKIVDETMTNGTAYTNLRMLCKQVGPRLSGSSNHYKAVLLTRQMLTTIGVDTVYLQACMVPHWVRGGKEAGEITITGGKKMPLHLTALGNSVGTGPHGIAAPVIEVRSMAELANLGSAIIKGKIVFFNFRMNPTYINAFIAYGESGVSRTKGPARHRLGRRREHRLPSRLQVPRPKGIWPGGSSRATCARPGCCRTRGPLSAGGSCGR